jgi:branched-chain amino acid transport system substrate-binding protein
MTEGALQSVDFSVIQTYSFIDAHGAVAKRVQEAMMQHYKVASADQIKAPVGVAQAYDLTRLLASAIDLAGSTDRLKIRNALENLGPYDGLIRHYAKPFDAQRHEALSADNVFFARYTADDKLLPLPAVKR